MAWRTTPRLEWMLMALREELEEQGNWLFKRRSYLPLVLFVPVFVAIATAGPKAESALVEGAWELFCVVVSLSGLVVRAVAVGHAPWGTSGRNTAGQLASCLNCTGLYATVRQGNSGGPLLTAEGEVYGVVFAKSLDNAQTGYALTADEIQEDIAKGRTANQQVDSDSCAL